MWHDCALDGRQGLPRGLLSEFVVDALQFLLSGVEPFGGGRESDRQVRVDDAANGARRVLRRGPVLSEALRVEAVRVVAAQREHGAIHVGVSESCVA